MSSDEIIDILNDKGGVVDTITREEAERGNSITENVIVFVFNYDGEVWIQKRPKTKKHYPNLWDVSACGSVHSGENKMAAARREQFEEMGFTCNLKFAETFMNVFPNEDGKVIRQRLSHVFIGKSDEIPLPNEEVDEFLALPYESLRQKVVDSPQDYVPSFLVELDKATKAYKIMV